MGTLLVSAIFFLVIGIILMYMASKSSDTNGKSNGPVEGCGCVLFIVGVLFVIGILIATFS